MTDKDIIKALKCLRGCAFKCSECPYSLKYPFPLCERQVAEDCFDLIIRQKCEIVKQKCIKQLLREDIKTAKSEAFKEFAKRLKEKYKPYVILGSGVAEIEIDNLVKEMVGENNG